MKPFFLIIDHNFFNEKILFHLSPTTNCRKLSVLFLERQMGDLWNNGLNVTLLFMEFHLQGNDFFWTKTWSVLFLGRQMGELWNNGFSKQKFTKDLPEFYQNVLFHWWNFNFKEFWIYEENFFLVFFLWKYNLGL